MPNVFMSYARADLEIVRQLEKGLLEGGIAVWRDQERLYGGQKWPKELGKAIAAMADLGGALCGCVDSHHAGRRIAR